MLDTRLESRFQFVIVGGSLYSLVVAGALIRGGIRPNEILLVEGSSYLGGQFKSYRTEGGLLFDSGTRILYETGDQRADEFISQIIERCESSVLSGNRRDIGGVFSITILRLALFFRLFEASLPQNKPKFSARFL